MPALDFSKITVSRTRLIPAWLALVAAPTCRGPSRRQKLRWRRESRGTFYPPPAVSSCI